MSLFGTLNTGATGLGASGTSLSVIGNNIANINTTGFKGGRANFASLMPNTIGSVGGSSQLGMGTSIMNTQTLFGQGVVSSSDSALDVAISGSGFFAVRGGNEQFYTRDGSFFLDSDGYVTTGGGMNVQGFNAIDGSVTGQIGDLKVDTGTIAPQVTETIGLAMQLSANAEANATTELSGLTLDGATETIKEAVSAVEENGGYSTSITMYDNLGVAHDVTMLFERTSDGASGASWEWKAVMDGGEFDNASYTDESALEIASGQLDFDGDGELLTATSTMSLTDLFPGTTDVWSPDFQFGMDAAGNATDEGGVGATGESYSLTSISQDGYAPGEVTNLEVDEDGYMTATYTNGEEMVLGQLALASFDSTAGLDEVGGNIFRATGASGAPALGAPGTGDRGDVTGYALEKSNVELEDQFVQMITAQRGYQANSRVVSTASDTLQELVNLV